MRLSPGSTGEFAVIHPGRRLTALRERQLRKGNRQRLTGVLLPGVLENIFWGRRRLSTRSNSLSAPPSPTRRLRAAEQPVCDELDCGDRVIWRPADADDPPLYPDSVAELIGASGLRPARR